METVKRKLHKSHLVKKESNLVILMVTIVLVGFFLSLLMFTRVSGLAIVSGASMEGTLHDGDRVAILSNPRLSAINRGNIVIVDYRSHLGGNFIPGIGGDPEFIVKRAVAVAGDTVQFRSELIEGRVFAVLYVNGERLEESYIKEPFGFIHGQTDEIITVGENRFFVLGDNRNNSTDSRHPRVGTVHVDHVVGLYMRRLRQGSFLYWAHRILFLDFGRQQSVSARRSDEAVCHR